MIKFEMCVSMCYMGILKNFFVFTTILILELHDTVALPIIFLVDTNMFLHMNEDMHLYVPRTDLGIVNLGVFCT